MDPNTDLNLDMILELVALLREDNRYTKIPFTLADVYDIYNAFC